MMKNIKRIICVASVLAGLLLFAACDDPLDGSRVQSKQDDVNKFLEKGLPEEDLEFDEEGFEWISVFNEDGTMYDIRIPIEEESKVDRSEELIQEPDFVVIKTFDGEKWVDDSRMQGADRGMRNIQSNRSIVLLFIGDGFMSFERQLFEKKALEAAEHIIRTYPFNLFSAYFTVYGALWYSDESGVSRDPSKGGTINSPIVNNYFGSCFKHDGTRYILYVNKLSLVSSSIETLGLNPNMRVMLVNSNTTGGVAYIDRALAVSTIRDDPGYNNFRRIV
jgi:hypothetical protein